MTPGARGRGLLLTIALAATFLVSTPVARADVSAQGCSARAVVVIEPGPGAVPICFDGSISGLDALQLAGANPVTYGFAGQGAAVCQLYGVGNPADSSCLTGSDGNYWAYYRAGPGASGWTYSRGGAGSSTVTDGSVEGWRFGGGDAPGFVSFCAVVSCAPPPTDPPATAAPPPVTATPAGGTTPATAAPAASSSAGKDDKGAKGSKDGKGSDVGAAGTADGATSTTGTSGSTTASKSDGKHRDSVELASGSAGGGGGGGGSPLGVIVAVVVIAAGVAGGLWFRKRRAGPAPG